MENFIQGSKYRAETISIVVSFQDLLSPGDTITGTPVISVTVYTGFDDSPSDILYLGSTVTLGSVIEQRFRLGVVGVIYHITFSVVTFAGDLFDKECYLAILPDDDKAVPTYLPIFETSTLYPNYFSDSIKSNIAWTSGKTISAYSLDWISSYIMFRGGVVVGTAQAYTIPLDAFQTVGTWISGYLSGNANNYPIPYDAVKTSVSWISASLYGTAVTYSIPMDAMKTSVLWTAGSLV